MAEKLTQQHLPFSEKPTEPQAKSARPEPSEDTLGAIAMLETWLSDPRTGKMTAAGMEALEAVRKILVDGKNGWWHVAENRLENLAVRNGRGWPSGTGFAGLLPVAPGRKTMNALLILADETGVDVGAGIAGGLFGMMAVIWLLVIAATIFWLWALIDALTNEPTTNDKILWFLVIFFLHFVGALVYVVVRRGNRTRTVV